MGLIRRAAFVGIGALFIVGCQKGEEGEGLLGSYAFVTFSIDNTQGSLRVLDISNPTDPKEVAALDVPGWLADVFVSGAYVYISARDSGLRVIDASDPSSPVEVGSLVLTGSIRETDVEGDYAFSHYYETDSALISISVSDPSSPQKLAQSDIMGENIYVDGKYLYTCDSTLHILDISNPNNMTEVGSLHLGNASGAVVVAEGRAYVYCHDDNLKVVDVSDPTNPSLLGQCVVGYTIFPVLDYEDGYVYLGGSPSPNSFYVVDVSDPRNPKVVSSTLLSSGPHGHLSLVAKGGYVYLTDEFDGLKIVDVSNPSSPQVVASYDPYPGDDWIPAHVYVPK